METFRCLHPQQSLTDADMKVATEHHATSVTSSSGLTDCLRVFALLFPIEKKSLSVITSSVNFLSSKHPVSVCDLRRYGNETRARFGCQVHL